MNMTVKNDLKQPFIRSLLFKRAFIGYVIALVVILFFVLQATDPHPDWPKLWMIRPLIITPIAGALGGIAFHFLDSQSDQRTWTKILARTGGVIIYIIGLWMGVVLGLAGTMWN
jgi:hypothetical protein